MENKIMKPEDLITQNTLSDIVIGMEIVASPIALTAVNIARLEEKEKAINAFRKFVEDYCHESGRTDISESARHYIEVFKGIINSEL